MPRQRLTYNPSTSNCAQRRGWAQAGYDPLQDHLPDTLGFEHIVLNGLLEDRLETLAECVGLEARNAWYFDAFEAIADQHGVSAFESSQYCIGAKRKSRYPQQADRRDHPDHLGSSSFITNASGNVDQHLQYLPFGEPWIDQRTQNNIRFTFSGKERDEETGYNYFGARYYNADISIWLSVDPMASERAWLTPYNYCSNNPIVRTDPSGMLDGEFRDNNGNVIGNDGKADNKVYIIKTTLQRFDSRVKSAGISDEEAQSAIGFVSANSGNSQAFDTPEGQQAKSAFIEVDLTKSQVNDMEKIAMQDNGWGGVSTHNNREYGGYSENGRIFEVSPGPYSNPREKSELNILLPSKQKSTFHIHNSGFAWDIKGNSHFWYQAPSFRDIDEAGDFIHFVIGRRNAPKFNDSVIYMYSKNGVEAVFSGSTLKKLAK